MALTPEDLDQIRSIFAEEIGRYYDRQEQRAQARRVQDAEREAVKRAVVEALHSEGGIAFASVIVERTSFSKATVLESLTALEHDGAVTSTREDPCMARLYSLKEIPANVTQPG